MDRKQRSQHVSLALQIIPPVQSREDPDQQALSLEVAMQSLVIDERHPVALELAGTPERRYFIVRATTRVALDHVEEQLRTLYPQLGVEPLREADDPFCLAEHETISAIELTAGGAVYLPHRTWQEKDMAPSNLSDPILSLLAALGKLPPGVRAVAQIGLVPARPDWSKRHWRKAVEKATEPEKRAREDLRALDGNGSEYVSRIIILVVAGLLGFLLLIWPLLPPWVGKALLSILSGGDPHLQGWQTFQLALGSIGLVLGMMAITFVITLVMSRMRQIFQPMYDQNQVLSKTSRMAYRVRLRLYAIGPASQQPDNQPRIFTIGVPLTGRLSMLRGTEFFLPGIDIVTTGQETPRLEARISLPSGRHKPGPDGQRLQDVLLRLIAAYRQYHLASGAYFVPKRLSFSLASRLISHERGRAGYGWQQGLSQSTHLLSVDTLAALWHLPASTALPELALMQHRRARSLLIPPDLARQSREFRTVGYSEHSGYRVPFALIPQFFRAHTLLGGKSGEGKSTCIEHIARDAMAHGGFVLVDPHGDLCDHILRVVPPERTDDIVLIDLSERDGSVGINPLDVTLGRGRDKAVSDLMKTFSHIWQEAWGPRMENAFEMALRTLFEANRLIVAHDRKNGPLRQYTLLDVLPILTNESFCHALLRQVHDDYLHRWWRDYYEPLTLMQQREVVNPVLSKVTKFESEIARRIIGQSVSTINFTEVIEQRKILLVKLAKGVVGADIAAIVGASLLGLIQITLEEQGNKLEEDRARLPIILDEFQVLAGVDYAALAELRKYGATFFLATQSLEYLQKLDEVLLPTVLANVRQFLIFNMSAQDAETLAPELGVEPEDILNLDPHMCYIKMATGDQRQPVFSLKMLPPSKGDATLAESIRARCRVRYTRRATEVDEMLQAAMIHNIRLIATDPQEEEAIEDDDTAKHHVQQPYTPPDRPVPASAPPARQKPRPATNQSGSRDFEQGRAEQEPEAPKPRSTRPLREEIERNWLEQVMVPRFASRQSETEQIEQRQIVAKHYSEILPGRSEPITTEAAAVASRDEFTLPVEVAPLAEVAPPAELYAGVVPPVEIVPEAGPLIEIMPQGEVEEGQEPRKRKKRKRGSGINKKLRRQQEAEMALQDQ